MTREQRQIIEEKALSLLVKQDLRGEYALSFFDYRKILTFGRASITSIQAYEKLTGVALPFHPEGMTVRYGNCNFILYDDNIKNRARINWTVAHELGHVFLEHGDDCLKNQREANLFASSLLIPEAVVRFLDCQKGEPISPDEMTNYFGASLSACRRRRDELDRLGIASPSNSALVLLNNLFGI